MGKTAIILIILTVALALIIYLSIKYPAKNLLTRLIRFFIILGLIIAIAVISIREYGPNGKNPIFSESGRGENEGQDEKQLFQDTSTNSGNPVIEEIVITGRDVTINGITYICIDGNFDEIDQALSVYFGNRVVIRLRDDYSIASIYHHVYDLLNSNGVEIISPDEKD